MSPHQVVHAAVPVDPQREVHRYQRRFEVAVHDEIRVRHPDVPVVVYGVQEVVPALVRVPQPGVVPLLLQQELHLVLLYTIRVCTRDERKEHERYNNNNNK